MPEPTFPLGPAGRAKWDEITADFEFDLATDYDLLTQYCAALDTIAALDSVIAESPLMVNTPSNGVVVNRAVTEKRAQVQLLQRLATQLNLSTEEEDPDDALAAAARSANARYAAQKRWGIR
jgi:hypothetical protein